MKQSVRSRGLEGIELKAFQVAFSSRFRGCSVLWMLLLLLVACPAFGQWLTQSVEIKTGWNGVFLHVDPSHQDLNTSVAGDSSNPITQVWRWSPPLIAQFIDTPHEPTDEVSGWSSWTRINPDSVLQRLVGNGAYLVESLSNYTWQVKGRPVAPRHYWNIEGLNLVGFPTVSAPATAPTFEDFLAQDPDLLNASGTQSSDLEIFRYAGTDLISNPKRISPALYRNTSIATVQRGKAFWIRAGTVFNKYFGPFEVVLPNAENIDFYDTLSTYRFRLKNFTTNTLSVSMKLMASESAPNGQPGIVNVPPLLVRGALDFETHEYGYTPLPAGATNIWTLAPKDAEGSEVEVVLGLDRLAMSDPVGSLLAGVLKFTDSLGYTEVDIPVSGEVAADGTGLWVGEALVTQVGQYLKSYQGGSTNPVVSTNGNYIVTGLNTNLTDVPSWCSLRLIVHNPESGAARLLQQVFYGMGTTSNLVLSRKETALDASELETARRISAVHLPWTEENTGWTFDGPLQQGTWITATVTNEFNDQRSNPFLHTYHPDHDNLDSAFDYEEPQGKESYTIVRTLRLQVTPPGSNFTSRVSGGKRLLGDYRETTQLIGLARAGGTNDTRTFEAQGVFRLDRISDISTLTDTL